ncbi:MAG: glycosyltransferase family 2 protein [Gammaproteobacteria bacterium]
MPSVSAILVCFNEEGNIGACLESLGWCDEIVVVDSFSTDRTVEICRQYTDRVIQREWAGYRDQKAFAHSQARNDWVLLLDSDERLSPELSQEIRQALSQDKDKYSGYSMPRMVFYLGRWWRRGGWYPDYKVRLFRRERGSWGGSDPHEKIIVHGKVRRLHSPIYHFSYRNIDDHLQRINKFTTTSSYELRKKGTRWRATDAVARPMFRFFRSYILERGFLEGFGGLYVAVTAAVYVFLKYAKLWELELEDKRKGDSGNEEPPAKNPTYRS